MARKTRRRVKRVRGTKRRIGVLRSRRIKRSRRYYTGGLDFGEIARQVQANAKQFGEQVTTQAYALKTRAFGPGSSEGTVVL